LPSDAVHWHAFWRKVSNVSEKYVATVFRINLGMNGSKADLLPGTEKRAFLLVSHITWN
jgi:hypothetical protein